MTDHLNQFFAIVDKLSEMKSNYYENFRIAIEFMDKLPTPEILKIKLMCYCSSLMYLL